MVQQRTFVYGTFKWPGRKLELRLPAPPGEPENAIEVLREFDSGLALRGKLYRRAGSPSWVPAQMDAVQQSPWYPTFEKNPKHVIFDMEGSTGVWEILYFRNESDEGGVYAAVGLRHSESIPAWLHFQKRL
jgi:hypothetical protein